MYAYPVYLEQDGDSVLVTFPDIPEAITFGADADEARLHAQDALETALELYVEARRPIPVPGKCSDEQRVAPSLLVQAKLAIYATMLEHNIRKADVARRLGWHMPQVDRILDLEHASKMPQIEQVAASLGIHMEINLSK